jgi:hypothetical protein
MHDGCSDHLSKIRCKVNGKDSLCLINIPVAVEESGHPPVGRKLMNRFSNTP